MSRLVSVLRRPELMLSVSVERARPFSSVPGPGVFRTRTAALTQTPEAICPWRDRDVRAWKSLGRVPNLSRRAAQAIVRSLIASVVAPSHEARELGELRFGGSPVDVRPYLCQLDGEELLLEMLGEAIPRDTELAPWHFERRAELAALPDKFQHYLLWGLALSGWPQVELTLAVYNELGLESDEESLLAVALIFTLCDRDAGLWWCDVLAELAPEVRAHAISVAIESEVLGARPDDDVRSLMIAGEWDDVLAMSER
jgi:hypothetical protein